MKFLIFLALVVFALAAPAKKPENHPGGPLGHKPSHPPPTGSIHPFHHHNVTGLPSHHNYSRPPHTQDSEDSNEHPFDHRNMTSHDNCSRPHYPQDSEDSNEHPFDHHNVTGHDNSSRPFHSEDLDGDDHPRHNSQVPDVFGSTAPKTGNPPPAKGPRPVGGSSHSGHSGKSPAEAVSQAKPGQGPKSRPKRHVNHSENHPTGAPHGDHTCSTHTHESGASRATHPANHGGGKPGGPKGQAKL